MEGIFLLKATTAEEHGKEEENPWARRDQFLRLDGISSCLGKILKLKFFFYEQTVSPLERFFKFYARLCDVSRSANDTVQ